MPKMTVLAVTPTVASEMLARHPKNRPLRPALVAAYARDMATGAWEFTGEAIKFDSDGNLIDGQHRLQAVIDADVEVQMLVVEGIRPKAQDVMDTGAKRAASDALHLNGYANANAVASVARFAVILESDGKVGRSVTHSEIFAWLAANPDVEEAVRRTRSYREDVDLTNTSLGYAWMVLFRVNPEACERFFEAVTNNITTGKGDPINTLIRRARSARLNKERLTNADQVQFIIRTWNAWRSGAQLSVLRTHASSPNAATASGGGRSAKGIRVAIPPIAS